MSSTTSGLKRKQELDASSAPKLGMPPEKIRCCPSNILDIPNEILVKMILFLNARERVGLGNSCKRFHSLVFEDEELLRNLDFSKNGRLTLASDVQQYFDIENSSSKILRVNLRNTDCIKPGHMLNDSIGKARNLVDVNIHGLKFKDVWQLGSLLNPLPHLLRLSFDWSEGEASDSRIILCSKVLQRPFSRLEYLSVEMEVMDCVKVFIRLLQLCQQLEELRMVVKESHPTSYANNWGEEPRKLKNLKVVEYCGPQVIQIKESFGTLLPNPEKWTDFQMDSCFDPDGFYLAIVDVCEELAASKWIERIPNIAPNNRSNLGWALFPELLLKEVLGITHKNVPEELCCLSTFTDEQRCLLKISEAKRLLKNPESQISYLYLNHPVDLGCDFHLVASAFANFTELWLAVVTRNLVRDERLVMEVHGYAITESFPTDSHFQRRLIRRDEAVLSELDETLNMDSSFRMLVENTPHLRNFTLGGHGRYENWDLEELHLIKKWKFLKSLRLIDIPIEDGEFLIGIGKQCKNLQYLGLRYLGPRADCCYEKELQQMLTNCQNLRGFLIDAPHFKEPSEILSSLASNVHLSQVEMKTVPPGFTDTAHQQSLASSIEHLLHQCPKLTTFFGDFRIPKFGCSTSGVSPLMDCLSSIQRRSKAALNRPNLQIKIGWGSTVVGYILRDSEYSNPFYPITVTQGLEALMTM